MLQSEPAPVTDNAWTKSQLFMECLGTFVLTYFCGLSVMMIDLRLNTGVGNALVQMLVLCFMIYAGARISGAHYNGSVTIALMVSRHVGLKKGVLYLLAQLTGALFAALLNMMYKALYHGHRKFPNDIGYPHADTKNFNVFACFSMELVSTIMLVLVVYKTAINNSKGVDSVYGFCISAVLGMSCLAIGPVTGAGLNPWRVFPAAILTGQLFTSGYGYAWIYYVGYPLAGVIVGLMWRFVYQERAAKQEAKPQTDDAQKTMLDAEGNARDEEN